MFNNSLKKQAIHIHDEMVEQYNSAYSDMSKSCDDLYKKRTEAVSLIEVITNVINSISNNPKEFETKMGKVGHNIKEFRETEEYAKEAYNESIKAGTGIVSGAAAGIGIASMAPSAMMSIATTFGTATTGTAISALSGAAAEKAAVAWIGRTFAGFAVKGTAGMAAGNAFLALAGPIGWSITAASTVISLASLTKKNKKISDDAVSEAKEIAKAREALKETTAKISSLLSKTDRLFSDLDSQKVKIVNMMNSDYRSFQESDCLFLGSIVNNTLTLSVLIGEKVE